MRTYNVLLRVLVVTLGVMCSACESARSIDQASETTRQGRSESQLWLAPGTPDLLIIARSSSGPGSDPRILEIWLQTSNVAALTRSEAGPALVSAAKELTVQDKGNGLIRVLAFSSSNTTPIGPGVLATLELERETDGPMRVEILTDRPMFAPQEAQEGLIVGDPIEL